MNSIYQKVLGADFQKLHPQIQKRFGFTSKDNTASVGSGVMEKVWYGKPYTVPFLYVGTRRNIMFPQKGTNIPFTIENYAYLELISTSRWILKLKRHPMADFTLFRKIPVGYSEGCVAGKGRAQGINGIRLEQHGESRSADTGHETFLRHSLENHFQQPVCRLFYG